MTTPEPDDDLGAKLRSWSVTVEAPADFQRQVWARIGSHQAQAEKSWSREASAWLGQFFSQPAVAFAVVLLSFFVGVEVAHEKGVAAHAQAWKLLEDRYASSINPVARHVAHVNHLDQ